MTVYLGSQRAVVLVGYEALAGQGDDFSGRLPLLKITKGYGKV